MRRSWPVPAMALLAALLVGTSMLAAAPRRQDPLLLYEGRLIFHYWPGGEPLAKRLARQVRLSPPLPALEPEATSITGGEPISIYLAPNETAFNELAHGHASDWSAGLAFPKARKIILPAYLSGRAAPGRLAAILRHELAHIALHDHLAPATAPRWFDEGYAQWAAGGWGTEAAWRLRVAFALDRAPALDQISLSWPTSGEDAEIAYLLALTAVAYLIENGGGEEGLQIFLARWREGGALEPALRATYGLTLAQFEDDWLRDVRRRFGWPLLLTHSFLVWSPLAVLVVLLTLRQRRRLRRRIEDLRQVEIPDSPAYWLGEGAEGALEEDGGNE